MKQSSPAISPSPKKAQDYLDARGVSYELRDIKENNPGYDVSWVW